MTARPRKHYAVPPWGSSFNVKAWLINHWLLEAVKEMTAYLKIESYQEARLLCRIANDINRNLWLHDVIWYDDYKEISKMLELIYNYTVEIEYECRVRASMMNGGHDDDC